MALKYRVTKAAYDKLSDEDKAHYEADGDKHYVVVVDGLEDSGALKRAKERVEQELTDLKAEAKEKDKQIKTLTDAAGEGGADVQRLQRSHERKITTLTEGHEAVVGGLKKFIIKVLKGSRATELATAISKAPKLLAREIEDRLDVDFDSAEEPALVIKNKDGKPDPSMTLDKLKAEFVANPEFKDILIGNRATGGDTHRGPLPGPGAPQPQHSGSGTDKAVDVNALDPKSFTERVRQRVEARQQNAGASAE